MWTGKFKKKKADLTWAEFQDETARKKAYNKTTIDYRKPGVKRGIL